MKKLLTLLFLVAVVLLGGAYYWQSGYNETPKFRTLPVARGDLFVGVTATGTVEPEELVEVGAQILGIIKSFGPDLDDPEKKKTIDFNSRVKAGTLLARIDDLPFLSKRDQAEANVLLEEAEVKQFRARSQQLERDFQRAERLRGTSISRQEYETILADFEAAKAGLAMAEAKLKLAAVALKQAEIDLGYTTIVSPVDGVVISRKVKIGETVLGSGGLTTPILFLIAKDLSRMKVSAAVNEADISEIHEGQKVSFKVDSARDRIFTGKVSQIRMDASLVSGVVTYDVIVAVDNRDGQLKPYTTARLQFEVARRTDALLVPNQALRWRPTWEQISPSARTGFKRPVPGEARRGESEKEREKEAQDPETELKVEVSSPTVWVVGGDGRVRPVPVKAGLSDDLMTEVLEGDLKPGAAVVINAVHEAKPDFVSGFINKIINKGE